jgi:hypothetical protein
VVAAGEYHRSTANRDTKPVEVGTSGSREHDAWTIVASKNEGSLGCARSQQHSFGHNLPQSLARLMRQWLSKVIADAFDGAVRIPIVRAKYRSSRQHTNAGQGGQFRAHLPSPGAARNTIYADPVPIQSAARHEIFIA